MILTIDPNFQRDIPAGFNGYLFWWFCRCAAAPLISMFDSLHTIIKLGYNLQKQKALITYNFYNHNYPIANKPLYILPYMTIWLIFPLNQ